MRTSRLYENGHCRYYTRPPALPIVFAKVIVDYNHIMKISIVIPTLDRPRELRKCLLSISAQSRVPDEIVIVDAGKELRQVIEGDELGEVDFVHICAKPGTSAQKNLGASRAHGDVLIFLDDDVVLDRKYVDAIEHEFIDNPEIGAVTGLITNYRDDRMLGPNSIFRRILWGSRFGDGKFTSYGLVRYLAPPFGRREVEFMAGGNTAVRRSIWDEIRFDENLLGYALCEDEDFSYRVSRKCRTVFTPRARLKHFQRELTSEEQKHLGRFLVVNRNYIFRKNFPQTLRSKTGFHFMVYGLLLHRVLNRSWSGAQGVLQGYLSIARNQGS